MLSSSEQTQLRTLAAREGGVQALISQIHTDDIAGRIDATLSLVGSVGSLTVSSWASLRAIVSDQRARQLPVSYILDRIDAALVAGDAAKLGPLLVLLAAACKGHFRA